MKKVVIIGVGKIAGGIKIIINHLMLTIIIKTLIIT